jgi:hypothetical protein
MTPGDIVTINLGDGRERELRYSLATCRRLKAKFGKAALTGALLRELDEDTLPDVIFEGLMDREGITSADALAELLHPKQTPYLVERFTTAFTGSFPEADPKNEQSSQPTT